MASVVINGNTYNSVPYIQVPKSGGGSAQFYDTEDATATSGAHILAGYTGYGPAGKLTGTLTTPTITQDAGTHALTIS